MSNKLPLVKTLLQNVQADQQQYQQLLQLLQTQRLGMIRRDSEALQSTNGQILLTWKQLKESCDQRRQLLEQLAQPISRQGINTVLSWLPAPQQKLARGWWQQLENLAIRCRDYNEKNGDLLVHQYQFVQAFLGHENDFIYQP